MILLSLTYIIYHRNRFRQKLRTTSEVRRPMLLNIQTEFWNKEKFYSIRPHSVPTTPDLRAPIDVFSVVR